MTRLEFKKAEIREIELKKAELKKGDVDDHHYVLVRSINLKSLLKAHLHLVATTPR